MVKKYIKRYPWLMYACENKQGLSHARNRGARVASGSYLCYLDDDGKPGEKYLSRVHHILKKYRPDIAGGPVYPYYTAAKPKWFQDDFEIRRHAHKSGFCMGCSVSGGNFIIRADLLEELGMFSPHLGMVGKKVRLGEEKAVLLKYRSKYAPEDQRVYYSLEAFIYHHVPSHKMRIRYFFKRGFFSGRALVRLKNKTWKSALAPAGSLLDNLFVQLPLSAAGKARGGRHPAMVLQQVGIDAGKLSVHFQQLIRGSQKSTNPGNTS